MADHAAIASSSATTAAAASDDVATKRESHYNNQRSSLRSSLLLEEPSAGLPSQARTHSAAARLNDWDNDDIDPSPPSPGSTASPAPNVPYTRQRQRTDSGSRWKDKSSSKHTSRTTAESPLDKPGDLVPGSWLHVYTEAARPPNSPTSLRRPRTRARGQDSEADVEHVTPSPLRAHPASTLSLAPQHLAPVLASTSQLNITALPTMSPEQQDNYAELYMRSKPTPAARRASRLATELYTVSYLIFFSIWGTLARLGLQALTFYSATPLTFSVLWANVAGTLVMGFLAEDRRFFAAEWGYREASLPEPSDKPAPAPRHDDRARHGRVKKTIPMYVGLATGFCGSFTSFSSFIRDIFLSLSNDLRAPISHPYPANVQPPPPGDLEPRNGGYSFLALCATIIVTIATCYCALHVGAHLALALDRITPMIPFRLMRRIIDPLFVFLGWGVWIGAVVMAAVPPKDAWRSQALFACVFAPIGCLLRYYISLFLNPINPSFPVGTFTVNIFGTAVLGMAYDLEHVSLSTTGLVGGGLVGCQVLQGIMDGFCGCLTTVSTWIVEIDVLKRKAAYVYASLSVVTAFSLLLIIMGSVRWTVGWQAILCQT